jgi:hypothetical protein
MNIGQHGQHLALIFATDVDPALAAKFLYASAFADFAASLGIRIARLKEAMDFAGEACYSGDAAEGAAAEFNRLAVDLKWHGHEETPPDWAIEALYSAALIASRG